MIATLARTPTGAGDRPRPPAPCFRGSAQQWLSPHVIGGQPHLVLQQMCQRPRFGTLKQRRPNTGRFTHHVPPPTWTQGEHTLTCGTTAPAPPGDAVWSIAPE
jgi:hypothetical protein